MPLYLQPTNAAAAPTNVLPEPQVLATVSATASQILGVGGATPPGATYTLPYDGTYQIHFSCDFSWNPGDGALIAYIRTGAANAVPTPDRQAVFIPPSGTAQISRAVIGQSVTITGLAGDVVKLFVAKTSGTGISQTEQAHTGFSVILPGVASALPLTVYAGSPLAVSGAGAGPTNVNSVVLPAVNYVSRHDITMQAFQSLTVATDVYDTRLRYSIAGGADIEIVRSRGTGTGISVGGMNYTAKVPAGEARTYKVQVTREAGTGTLSSVADPTLNVLQVAVTPAA